MFVCRCVYVSNKLKKITMGTKWTSKLEQTQQSYLFYLSPKHVPPCSLPRVPNRVTHMVLPGQCVVSKDQQGSIFAVLQPCYPQG